MHRTLLAPLSALGLLACAPAASDEPTPEAPTPVAEPGPTGVLEVASPAPDGARFPTLQGVAGGAILSWTRPLEGGGAALEYSVLEGEAFGPVVEVVSEESMLVNWADGGGVVRGEGHWAAHWRRTRAGGYDAYVARSDDGRTWTEPRRLHDHDGPAEHGFVTALPQDDGTTAFTWLDGRSWDGGPEETSVLGRTLDADGDLGDEVVIDPLGCDCCPTEAVSTGTGALLAYRDRTAGEVRDIAVVAYDGATWGAPHVPVEDGWVIAGCPVNGPSVVASNGRALLAWLTAADDWARVQAIRLTDEGEVAGRVEVLADGGRLTGRVDALLEPSGAALVTWIDEVDGEPTLRGRWLRADDVLDDPFTIAPVPRGSSAGNPQIVSTDAGVLLAWTRPGTPPALGLGFLE